MIISDMNYLETIAVDTPIDGGDAQGNLGGLVQRARVRLNGVGAAVAVNTGNIIQNNINIPITVAPVISL